MSFDASDFLAGLYGDRLATSTASPVDPVEGARETADRPGPPYPGFTILRIPDPTITSDASLLPPAIDAPSSPFHGWVCRPDHRDQPGWEPPALDESERWWAHPENIIEPGAACPQCGSLEKWWDPTGGEHCQRCEPDRLRRALDLASRSAALRSRTTGRPSESTPRADKG